MGVEGSGVFRVQGAQTELVVVVAAVQEGGRGCGGVGVERERETCR
jgi:hypothetical protein